MRTEHDLNEIDLNLLHALVVLLDADSVSEAGRRLGVTQSAASRALGRLRTLFSDPLLVRVGQHMVPTEKALALHSAAREWVGVTRTLLSTAPTFDPHTYRGVLRLAVSDYFQSAFLPSVVQRIHRLAPHVDVDISARFHNPHGLESGALDGVLNATGTVVGPGLIHTPLFQESFTVVTRADHPFTGSLDGYTAHKHLLVSHAGDRTGVVDRALAARGLDRRVAVVLPDFLGAFEWVATSDLIVTLPTGLANTQRHRSDLAFHRPPLDLPAIQLAFFWHERRRTDPVHAWFRSQIRAAATDVLM